MASPKMLRAEIERQRAAAPDRTPVVSLELFFTGNDDLGSIGCNLADHPGIEKFRDTLLTIRTRSDVNDVAVAISDDMEDEEWPFVDTVIVVTSAPADEVLDWAAALTPDDTLEGVDVPDCSGPIPAGMRRIGIWWD